VTVCIEGKDITVRNVQREKMGGRGMIIGQTNERNGQGVQKKGGNEIKERRKRLWGEDTKEIIVRRTLTGFLPYLIYRYC
jgi:hypothetical protein